MKKDESKEKLDFEQVSEDKVKFLEDHRWMVLATSYNDRVTARTVDYASDGLDIYFLSWQHHTKCAQIKGNPRVASCIENVQIEGKAEILGDPLDEKNKAYADIYRSKLPDVFARFAPRPGMVIVKVTPTFVVTFVRNPSRMYLEHLDPENEIAYVFEEI